METTLVEKYPVLYMIKEEMEDSETPKFGVVIKGDILAEAEHELCSVPCTCCGKDVRNSTNRVGWAELDCEGGDWHGWARLCLKCYAALIIELQHIPDGQWDTALPVTVMHLLQLTVGGECNFDWNNPPYGLLELMDKLEGENQ